jgi:hypothetical protein
MTLYEKKMGFAMLLCFGLIHSSEQKHSLPIAEFCANILDDNKYELVLTRNIEIPKNKKWNVPDSLDGGCTSWEYNYLLEAPQSTKEDDFELFMRKGGHFCFSANSPEKRKVEPLRTELIKGNSYLGYFLENAKESLKNYYGKKIKGQWFAQLDNSKIKLSSNFTAVITGECSVNSNIAEFCAEFNKDSNEYSLHLVKNLNLEPESNWVFPDSVICNVYNGEPIWEIEYSLDAPYDSDSSAFIGGCVALEATPSSNTLCLKPKIVKVNLNPINRDVLHIHKYRAKETLKSYYGKSFKGHWKAQLGGTGFTYEKSFEATIVGPCSKKEIVAEYCIDENHRLVLDKELDYIPRYIFAPATECHVCSENYKETTTTSVDYGNGKFTPVERVLYKSCEDYVLYEYFRLPQNLKKERFLYGKVLPVRINAEIQSGELRRKGYYDFRIRVNGPCEK